MHIFMAGPTRMFRLCQETHQRPFGEAKQHDKEVRVLKEEREKEVGTLQKELAACGKKVDTLENELNTNRNQRAANEEKANNQTRELEEKLRNMTDQVNWNKKLTLALGAVIIFVTVSVRIIF